MAFGYDICASVVFTVSVSLASGAFSGKDGQCVLLHKFNKTVNIVIKWLT